MSDSKFNSNIDEISKLLRENREKLNRLCEMRIASGEDLSQQFSVNSGRIRRAGRHRDSEGKAAGNDRQTKEGRCG